METVEQNNTKSQDRPFLFATVFLSLLIGCLYVFLVKPGTPHDEPSHFANVQYYAEHLRMPFLGEGDSTYEGYMGPVYYALAASVYKITSFGDEQTGFYALRLADTLLLIPAILLTYALCQRLWKNRAVSRLATLFVALNPVLIGLAASIQNDMISIVEFLALSYLTLRWLSKSRPTIPLGAAMGFLVGLTMLTKLTIIVLLFSVPLYALAIHRRQALPFVFSYAALAALTCGWWFARNFHLYGDFTGIRGLRIYAPFALGATRQIYRPGEFFGWTRGILTWYWLPVEYYRNDIKAGIIQRFIIVLFTLLGVTGWIKHFKDRASSGDATARLYFALQYAAMIALFGYITLRVFSYPARNIMPTLALYGMALSFGLWKLVGDKNETRMKPMTAALAAALLLTSAQTLRAVSCVPLHPYNLFHARAESIRMKDHPKKSAPPTENNP